MQNSGLLYLHKPENEKKQGYLCTKDDFPYTFVSGYDKIKSRSTIKGFACDTVW